MSRVFWTMLKERHGVAYAESLDSLLAITEHNARLDGYHRWISRPLPVAHARNAACQAFMEVKAVQGSPIEQSPDDTLVMLDCDHVMQPDIVERLAAHKEGVVGALATSRGEVPFLCFFGRGPDGGIYNMSEWKDGELAEGVIIGSGAIAIKRWVLYRLQHCQPSWFRYQYGGYRFEATEEMYFGYECARAGIPHYCDTNLWIPHITTAYTTPAEWREWLKDNPGIRHKVEVPTEFKDIETPPAQVAATPNGHSGGDVWKQEPQPQNIAEVLTRRI